MILNSYGSRAGCLSVFVRAARRHSVMSAGAFWLQSGVAKRNLSGTADDFRVIRLNLRRGSFYFL